MPRHRVAAVSDNGGRGVSVFGIGPNAHDSLHFAIKSVCTHSACCPVLVTLDLVTFYSCYFLFLLSFIFGTPRSGYVLFLLPSILVAILFRIRLVFCSCCFRFLLPSIHVSLNCNHPLSLLFSYCVLFGYCILCIELCEGIDQNSTPCNCKWVVKLACRLCGCRWVQKAYSGFN